MNRRHGWGYKKIKGLLGLSLFGFRSDLICEADGSLFASDIELSFPLSIQTKSTFQVKFKPAK